MTCDLMAPLDSTHVPMLLVIGTAIFFGTIGAGIFQRLHIPQVVGYITIGLFAGRSGLGLLDERAIESLRPFNLFALGIIGFLIGGELRRDVFRKYGRQFMVILLSEGLGSFVLVSLLVTTAAWLLGQSVAISIALGIIFGALSSATAPAATVNVLWEYKTRGVLTTAVYAIVAMDDGLALILYSIGASIATKLVTPGGEGAGLLAGLARTSWELLGAVMLGTVGAVALSFLLRRTREQGGALGLVIGSVALVIGGSRWLGVDIILTAMTLGVVMADITGRRGAEVREMIQRFAPPIYVLFFVIVGAHLDVRAMPAWMWAMAVPYIAARTAGKMFGANLGARLARAAPVLRKYLGMCLFCQGGVAVGLAIMAASRFDSRIGTAIIMVIAVTTLVVEILGPPCVKWAVKRAGEVGLDVTEDDLMHSYSVRDVMGTSVPSFAENATAAHILRTIADTDAMSYPVVDAQNKLKGIITIGYLKESFGAEGLAEWLVAYDLMEPVAATVSEDTVLADAVDTMRRDCLDYLPVVAKNDDGKLVGMLELRSVNRRLSQEILRRRRQAQPEAV